MSLARFALRISAVEALKGQTLVGQNVRDSDFGAIDVAGDGTIRTDQDKPFVLVYTDDGTATDVATRDLRQNGEIEFVCEFGIASPMLEIDEDTGASVIVGVNLPATDAAFEATLDLLDRQIVAALTGPGDWPEIWRGLSDSVTKIERRRISVAKDGIRLAARQLRIFLEARSDPVMGQPLATTSVWRRFKDAAETANPSLSAILGAFLTSSEATVTLDILKASRGHTDAAAGALGYGPKFDEGDTIQTGEIRTDAPAG